MLVLWLLACFSSAPPAPLAPAGLPDDALRVTLVEGDVVLAPVNGPAGAPVLQVPVRTLDREPVDATQPVLVEGLAGVGGVWIDLPGDTPWYRVRKMIGSARAAGVPAIWLGVSNEAAAPVLAGEEPTIGLKMSCRNGPLAWTGVQPRVTLAIQRSAEGTWVVANARFLPVVDGVPTDGLPPECLASVTCADRYAGAEAEACEAGRVEPFAGRVELGGEVGCMLPFLGPETPLASWVDALPPVLKSLTLDAGDPVLVSPEAKVRWDAVVAVLRGFPDAGLPVPALGKPLVEGNDGIPMCTADVRDGAGLRAAGARRAGTLMGGEIPPDAP